MAATKREWLIRVLSFGAGFFVGRLSAPRNLPEAEATAEPQPTDEELVAGTITLVAGTYQFLRSLAEAPEVFVKAVGGLGPRATRRWEETVSAWPFLYSRAFESIISPYDIDGMLTSTLDRIAAEPAVIPDRTTFIPSLRPERLIAVPPPTGRHYVLVVRIAKAAARQYRPFVSEIAADIAARTDEDALADLGLSAVECARAVSKLAVAVRPALGLSSKFIVEQWEKSDPARLQWMFPIRELFESGEYENYQLQCTQSGCGWSVDSGNRDELARFAKCPRCGGDSFATACWNPL